MVKRTRNFIENNMEIEKMKRFNQFKNEFSYKSKLWLLDLIEKFKQIESTPTQQDIDEIKLKLNALESRGKILSIDRGRINKKFSELK